MLSCSETGGVISTHVAAVLGLAMFVSAASGQGTQPLRHEAQYTRIYSDNIEPPGPGLRLEGAATIVTDPALVLNGTASLRLNSARNLSTDPTAWPLRPNTSYIVELQYRILNRGNNTDLLFVNLHPAGNRDPRVSIFMPSLFRNAADSGTFSSGAQTNSSASYVLDIAAGNGVSILIDDIVIYRQDVVQTTAPDWTRLGTLPFPRLGAWYSDNPDYQASNGLHGVQPYYYTVEQIEQRLAFADVISGLPNQMVGLDSIRRLRQLNPGAVILTFSFIELAPGDTPPPATGLVDPLYQFQQGLASSWYVKDTLGTDVVGLDGIKKMNVTQYSPVVNGKTYGDYVADFIDQAIFGAGVWDGFFTDVLNDRIDETIPNRRDPALLDADYNLNGLRDESPAEISEWVRTGAAGILQDLRIRVGDTQLIMGNAAWEPYAAFAPYLNGYVLECTNIEWAPPGATSYDEAGWRRSFDAYRIVQATTRRPAMNIVNGCGGVYSNYSGTYTVATDADIARQRMILGTALLDDGFYYYGLCCYGSAPYWFDEMSVDENGVAVEDRQYKGYLGSALSLATDLAPGGPLILQEDFEAPSLSQNYRVSGAVSVSHVASEIIAGRGSLIFNNPDHSRVGSVSISTKPGTLQLTQGNTYLIQADWRILETLDDSFKVSVCSNDGACFGSHILGIVAGDSGTINLPLTVTAAASEWTLFLGIFNGGGKIAIDNLRILQGGAGPWRRDFENGFVLVNPLNAPRTFSASGLAGTFHRTGIRRIRGSQAPDINSGQPVMGDLTLAPFDAIILLADRIPLGVPSISGVNTPGGYAGIAQNGWIEIQGINLAPPGVGGKGMTWDNAPNFALGRMPAQLGGVSVTVDGKPAFVYFVSPTQINALSPLNSKIGPVEVIVTSGGVTSQPFVVDMRVAAPSFPLVGTTPYVVATHADYSLVGPASLSSPGYPFTPARPGEIIVLYGFGFGLPTTALVDGSSSQSGPLPALPTIQIGNTPATVTFAGLISPGLYQFNVTIPSTAQDGDNVVTCSYNGSTSPAGDTLFVQR